MMNRLALYEVVGPLHDLNQKLAGENGGEWLRALTKMLRKENPWQHDFAVWKTILLGNGKNADDLRNEVKAKEMRIGVSIKHMLASSGFSVAHEQYEATLVVVSVAELGFDEGTLLKHIYKRAKADGLKLCPSEVGPQLRVQYEDQPIGEWLNIGMEPILDWEKHPHLFLVMRDSGGPLLGSVSADPNFVWEPGDLFVFMK